MNRKNILIGFGASVLGGLIIMATGWNFSATANMPNKYVSKEDNSSEHRTITDKLDYIVTLIIELHTKDKE